MVLGLMVAVGARAQPMKYDVAEFVVPEGFTARKGNGQLELTHVDQARGLYLQIVVYDSRASLGTPAQDFAAEWKQTVAVSFTGDTVPSPVASKLPATVPLFEGAASVSSGSGPADAHLFVFELGGRILTVMVIAPNRGAFETMRPTLTRFFQGLRVSPAPSAAAPSPGPQKPGTAKWTGARIVGLWLGFKDVSELELSAVSGTFDAYHSKHRMRWRTFLADGSSYEGLPRTALLSLDVAAARADANDGPFWGTWTVQGDLVTARQPSGRVQQYHLDGDTLKEDAQTTGHATFWRALSVDGLRLDGTWSSFMKWSDSLAGPKWTTAPVIAFTRDGRFVDRGAFMDSTLDALTAQNAPRHPGKGGYEIRGYTLVLHYDDGREVQRPFMGAMKTNPARDASIVFIGEFPFYRQ